MRKFSLAFVAMVLFATSNVFAFEVNPKDNLSAQITKMLSKNNFANLADDLTAQVRFTLNKDCEIVILSVETEHTLLESFVKGKLNYKKVELAEVQEGKIYTVPVRIKA